MIQYGQNIIQLAYIKQISNYKLYNKASYYLNFTEKKIPKSTIQTFHDLIASLLLKIQNKYDQNEKDPSIMKIFIKSGFNNLDHIISGFHDGDLIVIAGRPSMGKTSLAMNIACNLINNINTGLCIFSLEMSSEQILYKLIAISCNMNINYLIFNKFSKSQWTKIKTICNKLLKNFIYINDKANTSIDYLEYTSKLLKKENNNIQLIIIDYLQLIQTESLNQINRTQEISYITRKLKLLAQYLNVPVIVLSQLNRSIEMRNNKEPMLSDLKESGCIYINQVIDLQENKISLNIKSLISNSSMSKLLKITNNKITQNQTLKYKLNIHLFIEYVFKCNIVNNITISTTSNHKFLNPNDWERIDNTLDKSSILNIISSSYYLQKLSYIKNIKFSEESFVYDLYLKKYFHFICNQIILHNSIEQDSDIVMIIYESEQQEISNSKILDINVCKNRNGSTGSFKLLFIPTTNTFKDLDLDSIN
uniref:DNA 5'-3' helicase DnaB n=1 Tax=Plumaria plumosa TaxID=189642 RepID=A0A4D6WX87_9FLOR|nr:replication helicase subunit [Plumaria plumosa]